MSVASLCRMGQVPRYYFTLLVGIGEHAQSLRDVSVAALTPLVVKEIGDGNKEEDTKVRMC
jgi:hypothetical protein